MHKGNKTRGKGQLLPHRYSIVYHPLRQNLDLEIFEYCLLETLVRYSNKFFEYSNGVKFLADYLLVSRNRVYGAIKKFAGRGWITGDADGKRFTLDAELSEVLKNASTATSENLRYTQIFHVLRKNLDIDYKHYCFLDIVFHISKNNGISLAAPGYFKELLNMPERDFYRKRDELSPFVIRSGVFGLKLKPNTKAQFIKFETILEEKCSKTAE